MNEAIMYFLKVNIAIALFYLFYRLVFNRDTFWGARRFYLVFTIVLSALHPLISFSGWLEKQEPMQVIMTSYVGLQEITVTATPVTLSIITPKNLLLAVYALVSLILLIKMCMQLLSILRWKMKGKRQMLFETQIVAIDGAITPFSFFKSIFINPELHNEQETRQILTHELTHTREGHSLDVLLSEVLTIICWINPAAWLLKREIRQNLEFLADNKVLQSGFDSKTYQYHLLQLSYQVPEINLVNKFNVSPLKKRITMMNQQKTAKAGLLKYSLIVPLALALVLSSNAQTLVNKTKKAFTTNKEIVRTKKQKAVKSTVKFTAPVIQKDSANRNDVYEMVEKMPQYPGGESALIEYLSKSIKYPEEAMKNNVEAKVTVRYIINKSGSIEQATIANCDSKQTINSVEYKNKGKIVPTQKETEQQILMAEKEFKQEALRVVNAMSKWTPGEQNGKKVSVYYTMPISFKLQENNGEKKESINKDVVYTMIEKMPEFPGGEKALMSYISQNVRYPIDAQEEGIEGKVVVRFLINKFGKVEKAEIVRGLYPSVDAEGLKVVNSLPDWIPGEHKGEKVSVYYTLPISFKLDNGKKTVDIFKNGKLDFTGIKDEAKPLIVLNGKAIPFEEASEIKEDNVKEITVLKDAAAFRLYGDKGKNGVILITLKK